MINSFPWKRRIECRRVASDGFATTLLCSVLLVSVFGISAVETIAQDRISLRDEKTGKVTEFQAMVISWDTAQLVYSGNNRQSNVAGSRVVDVVYARSESQSAADQQFGNGHFAQAWQSYEHAIDSESRDWIKVEMLARKLRCASALGRQTDSIRSFLQIQKATPRSRFFHLIPIPWNNARPDGALIEQYDSWLNGHDEIQQLIAASWLLATHEQAASDKLKELAQSEDPRIAHLAGAQLWRPRVVAARQSDLQRWRTAVQRMPGPFQAGPRFQIALAYKHMVANENRSNENATAHDQALVDLMQIPILFPEQYQLCGLALGEAHQLLKAAGRDDEARLVRAELKRDFGLSSAASSESEIQDFDR